MKAAVFNKFVAFLEELEQQEISYTLAHHREEAIMVLIAMPGERWEVEFMSDGSVEVEKFVSTGEIFDAKSLDELFARYADPEESTESSTKTKFLSSTDKVA